MSSKITVAAANRCDAIRELIPEYAFGLTDAEQTRFVEANLANCADAAAELADFQRLQAEMRADVAQIEPPLSLESKLMAAIAEPLPQPTARTVPLPEPVVLPRRRSIPVGWLVAAAAIIVLLVTNGYWLTRVNDLNTVNQKQAELIAQTTTVGDNPAFVLTSTSGLRWVRLPPAEENADTSAFLMWNAESKIGLLYAHGFPKLAVGKKYQLWLTRGETRNSVGTFTVDEEGKGAFLFKSETPIDEFTWARITDEPADGSVQPTGPIVVIGKLST
jgi:anti-sigma-K factor RskA